MGLEIIEKDGSGKPGSAYAKTSCCKCGCVLESRAKRIRMKERDFICESCYRSMCYPESARIRRETVG